jgi:mRNA-degrading endonuclease RelE of RelBE toxin-antitoxin system
MENEIYLTSLAGSQIEKMPSTDRETVRKAVEALRNGGWENSQIVVPDSKPGGGLRARLQGNIRLLFRYSPEQHAIVVADVASIYERELSATA